MLNRAIEFGGRRPFRLSRTLPATGRLFLSHEAQFALAASGGISPRNASSVSQPSVYSDATTGSRGVKVRRDHLSASASQRILLFGSRLANCRHNAARALNSREPVIDASLP